MHYRDVENASKRHIITVMLHQSLRASSTTIVQGIDYQRYMNLELYCHEQRTDTHLLAVHSSDSGTYITMPAAIWPDSQGLPSQTPAEPNAIIMPQSSQSLSHPHPNRFEACCQRDLPTGPRSLCQSIGYARQ